MNGVFQAPMAGGLNRPWRNGRDASNGLGGLCCRLSTWKGALIVMSWECTS